MVSGGTFEGDPTRLVGVVHHLQSISDEALRLVRQFETAAPRYDAYPGEGDEYAEQLRPIWKKNKRDVTDTGTYLAKAVEAVVAAQVATLKKLTRPQEFALDNIDELDSHFDELGGSNGPGSDGDRR
ncbi:hypothetical protein [Streptomyces sp.]|uniref:hypothetical protein n=1 Tax=Streptomyces sp. TaxID=1931 RepID=UPI002F419DDE